MEKTTNFCIKDFRSELIRKTINEVAEALTERGYDPATQLVGYLTTTDPAYITSYKDARKKIQALSTYDILEEMVKQYIK